ncbi:MAG TPA: glutamate synthase subunit beta, partial [Bacteroidales bacterium]|nr:glutamate synthase subunit beta [Bacteroidales bacterium]
HVPVTIRENEASVTERAFMEGWITAQPPIKRSGKRVAVIGSGPAGLVAAFRLNRKGHSVTVFEKDEQAGGLLRFGIPNFKLNKAVIDRRLTLLEMEGIVFKTGVVVGADVTYKALTDQFDAICLAIGAGKPRDLPVEGRDLKGVYFALDYLIDQNKQLAGIAAGKPELNAKGKHVLVIGGGDTGSDCVGTANRQGAASVTQIEIMPKPPIGENPETPWPNYPTILKVSSSHEEGCTRRWALATKRFVGENGTLTGVEIVEVEWVKDPNSGRMLMKETDKVEVLTVDLAFLAMGFVSPVHEGLLDQMEVAYDVRSNVAVNAQLQTSIEKVFAAGDVATGASLVVRAMASGRTMATCVHAFLTKK